METVDLNSTENLVILMLKQDFTVQQIMDAIDISYEELISINHQNILL